MAGALRPRPRCNSAIASPRSCRHHGRTANLHFGVPARTAAQRKRAGIQRTSFMSRNCVHPWLLEVLQRWP